MIIIKDKEKTSLIHLSNSTNVDDYIVQDLYNSTIEELYKLLEELDEKIDTPSEPSEPDEPTGDVKLQNIKYAIIKKIMSTINPDKGFDGMKSVEIDATQVYESGKEKGYQNGKQDGIDEGYATGKQDGIDEQKSKLSSISITENGTYVNKDGYNKVVVDIETNPIAIQDYKSVEISEINETITPDDGFDGMKSVSVNANQVYENGRIDGIEEQKNKLTSITINSNGTYNKEDGYNKITVNVKAESYSHLTNTVDVEGLSELGWSDDDINYYRDNTMHYEWQNDEYVVTEGNKNIVINGASDIANYRYNPDFVYCPYFDVGGNYGYELFANCEHLKSIPILNIGGRYNYNLRSCFMNCESLTTIPLLDTSNVTYMGGMFDRCKSLTTIPLLDTSNVTDMSRMFHSCSKLESLPLLDTSKVVNMGSMFYFCTSLTNIPPLYTSNVTYMSDMFYGCESLTTIPLLDTSNVTYMDGMFDRCKSLTTIPLLDTSNVTDMSRMFQGCESLTSIPPLDTSNVTIMKHMFYDCKSLTTIPLLDTSNVTDMSRMFHSCDSLTSIPPLDTSNVTDMSRMFHSCSKLESLPLLDFSNVTSLSVFFGYSDIATLTDLGGFKDLKIDWTSDGCLAECPNLTKQSVLNVITHLYNFRENGDTTTTKTIKFHAKSLALLSDEEKQIATSKGWVLTN